MYDDGKMCQTCASATDNQKPFWRGWGESMEACNSSCSDGFYRKIGESLKCVYKCEDNEFASLRTLNGTHQCATECEDKVFSDETNYKYGYNYRLCLSESEDYCGKFVRENVTIVGKDAQEEYRHCYGGYCPKSHPYKIADDQECYDACPSPRVGPLTGTVCTDKCGLYQELNEKRKCVCKGGLEISTNGKECVPPSEKTWKDFAKICTVEDRVLSITEKQCLESCKDNETPNDEKMCVCDELSIIHEGGIRCVKRTKCQRTFSKNGVPICLAAAVCKGDLKLALNDEHRCVEDCPSWILEDSGEQRCVEECPDGTKLGKDNQCETCEM